MSNYFGKIREKHQEVKQSINELQFLMEADEGELSDRDLKRLDKGIVLIKVGCKLLRKVFRGKAG